MLFSAKEQYNDVIIIYNHKMMGLDQKHCQRISLNKVKFKKI